MWPGTAGHRTGNADVELPSRPRGVSFSVSSPLTRSVSNQSSFQKSSVHHTYLRTFCRTRWDVRYLGVDEEYKRLLSLRPHESEQHTRQGRKKIPVVSKGEYLGFALLVP